MWQALQLLVLLSGLISNSSNSSVSPRTSGAYEREFKQRVSTILVENADGPVDATVWQQQSVRFVAHRRGDIDSSEITCNVTREHLSVLCKPRDSSDQIHLSVFVPANVHLRIQTTSGAVVITGILNGLSINTESGAVNIKIPESADVDLSLRTLEGKINQGVPVSLFGNPQSSMLDGRIGAGIASIIARTASGDITLSPADQPQRDTFGNSANNSRMQQNLIGSSVDQAVAHKTARTAESEDAIKLEGRLVNLNVKVTDDFGRMLPTLKKDDFTVLEDGIPQDLTFFETVNAPLNLVLLLDLSGSTEKKIKVMRKAAQRFVDALKPTERIAVAGFTRRFFIISNFTTDHKLLKDRIDDIKNRHSGTAYYDAMWSTLDLINEAGTTRKAIVVLTDGVDNSLDHPDDLEYTPKHGFDDLITRVEEADVTIYPIYLDTEYETIGRRGRDGHEAYVTARKQLEQLADQTGGVLFKAERPEDLDGVYKQVAAELHSLYSMAYMPKKLRKDGGWAKIGVTVAVPGAKVRAKRGYFAR